MLRAKKGWVDPTSLSSFPSSNDDVISFPPIQRRRPYAVKAAALTCLPSAVRLAGAALAVSAATTRAAPLAVSTHGLAPTAAAPWAGHYGATVGVLYAVHAMYR